jgi:tight adherence protein B
VIDQNEREIPVTVPYSYNVYQLSAKEKRRFLLLCGTGSMALAFLFYQNIFLSLAFAGLSYPGLKLYSGYLMEKRKMELNMQFRDVLYSLSASISSGRQMPEALSEAEQNMKLIYRENAVIVTELSQMVKRIFQSRESEEDILEDFAKRSGLDDIINFVDIYLTCRKTGGDFVKVIRKASEMIMDKITIDQEIRTLTAQKRFEIKILTCIPIAIVIFLKIVSPDYLAVLYQGIQGRFLMTLALIGIAASYLWSMRIIKIQV